MFRKPLKVSPAVVLLLFCIPYHAIAAPALKDPQQTPVAAVASPGAAVQEEDFTSEDGLNAHLVVDELEGKVQIQPTATTDTDGRNPADTNDRNPEDTITTTTTETLSSGSVPQPSFKDGEPQGDPAESSSPSSSPDGHSVPVQTGNPNDGTTVTGAPTTESPATSSTATPPVSSTTTIAPQQGSFFDRVVAILSSFVPSSWSPASTIQSYGSNFTSKSNDTSYTALLQNITVIISSIVGSAPVLKANQFSLIVPSFVNVPITNSQLLTELEKIRANPKFWDDAEAHVDSVCDRLKNFIKQQRDKTAQVSAALNSTPTIITERLLEMIPQTVVPKLASETTTTTTSVNPLEREMAVTEAVNAENVTVLGKESATVQEPLVDTDITEGHAAEKEALEIVVAKTDPVTDLVIPHQEPIQTSATRPVILVPTSHTPPEPGHPEEFADISSSALDVPATSMTVKQSTTPMMITTHQPEEQEQRQPTVELLTPVEFDLDPKTTNDEEAAMTLVSEVLAAEEAAEVAADIADAEIESTLRERDPTDGSVTVQNQMPVTPGTIELDGGNFDQEQRESSLKSLHLQRPLDGKYMPQQQLIASTDVQQELGHTEEDGQIPSAQRDKDVHTEQMIQGAISVEEKLSVEGSKTPLPTTPDDDGVSTTKLQSTTPAELPSSSSSTLHLITLPSSDDDDGGETPERPTSAPVRDGSGLARSNNPNHHQTTISAEVIPAVTEPSRDVIIGQPFPQPTISDHQAFNYPQPQQQQVIIVHSRVAPVVPSSTTGNHNEAMVMTSQGYYETSLPPLSSVPDSHHETGYQTQQQSVSQHITPANSLSMEDNNTAVGPNHHRHIAQEVHEENPSDHFRFEPVT